MTIETKAQATSFRQKVLKASPLWRFAIPWVVCLCGTVFYAYEYILRIEPSVMQSQLKHFFGLSQAGSWGSLVGLYYLAYTPMQIPAGPITDYWGPRRVLTAALGLCVLGLFLFYVTPMIWLAGMGRFMIGLGSAFAYIGASKLAVIWLPTRRFALFSGLTIGAGMLGAISGNLVVSNMVHELGWQKSLDLSLYLGLFLIPVVWLLAQDDYRPFTAQRMTGMLNLLKGVRQVFTYTQVWVAGAIACSLYIALSGFGELWGPVALQYVYGFPAEQAAELNSSVFWGALFGAPFAGWLSDFIGLRRLPLLIACCMSLVLSSLFIFWPLRSPIFVITVLSLYGFFTGFEIISFALGREYIGAKLAGTAVAFVNMLAMMSGLIYQPLIGWLLDVIGHGTVQNGIKRYAAQDYQHALAIIPLSLLVAIALATFWLKETYAQPLCDEEQ